MMKLARLPAIAAAATVLLCACAQGSMEGGMDVQMIKAKWRDYQPRFSYRRGASEYVVDGRVNPQMLEDGLNMIKMIRYVAGLSEDISFNRDKQDALKNEPHASGVFGNGWTVISDGVLEGYMADTNPAASNIPNVHHRDGVLAPGLTRVIFDYNTIDKSYPKNSLSTEGGGSGPFPPYVAWPAGPYHPAELFVDQTGNPGVIPWSVALNDDEFEPITKDDIDVTLRCVTMGRTWEFGTDDNDPTGLNQYFNVDGNQIIFRPGDLDLRDNLAWQEFVVTITGTMDKKTGRPRPIKYSIMFFPADD